MGRGRPRKEKPVKKEREQKDCKWCEKKFVPRDSNHIFCSRDCASAWQLNEKEVRNRARYYIFERDQFKCVYCGRSSIEHGALLLVDHIIPVFEGGDNSIYNVVTACSECNLKKGSSILEESVYRRIVQKNIEWITNISPMRKAFIEKVIERIKRNSDGNYDKYEDKRQHHIYGGVFRDKEDK